MATRAALLDAAIESICADGYAAVTTSEIARRAGVSRGAQLHHFPTKAELMTAAIEHLLALRVQEFREAFTAEALRGDLVDDGIDLLWTMFEGPAFVAWVELWVAARTDPDLAVAMADMDRRFTEETRLLFVELTRGAGAPDPGELEMVRDLVFAAMEGVALQRLVPRGQRPVADYLRLLKELAHVVLEPRDRSARRTERA
ncbi:MAG TPA: TetR family transcriptional regulator [Acidimicrobiia bacterium]